MVIQSWGEYRGYPLSMIIPVFLWLCESCEQESHMTTLEHTNPPGWENYDGYVMCPSCVVKALDKAQRRTEPGVALSIVERCP